MSLRTFFNQNKNRLALERIIDDLLFALAVLGFIAVFVDLAGVHSKWHGLFDLFYHACLLIFLGIFSLRSYLYKFILKKRREQWLTALEIVFIVMMLLAQHDNGFLDKLGTRDYLQFAISLIFLIEISKRSLGLDRLKVNPPLIFIFSFLILILIGSFALMLPGSSKNGVGFVNALFTSTSAVCVTGLTVMDTGADFTRFGQNVILTLISLGGLGVMTFTSFFGFFFKGGASFRNLMIYKDFMGENNLKNVFSTIIMIVTFTVGVEAIGTVILFFSLHSADFPNISEQLYFAGFHSISAFNNAGFQLKSAGLYDETLRWNYTFQTAIAILIIFGGLGFYISFNIVKYFRERLRARAISILRRKPLQHVPWIINLNTRIVLRTTIILLVTGTLFFFASEYHHSLEEHTGIGKWLAAFFWSVTPRTAGFNNIDIAALSREGILLTMLFMWIGASPGSTGGGIKTSTIAVAMLGIFQIARGSDHVDFAKREIAKESLMRAFIIICLSLTALGFSILAIGFLEPNLDLVKISFECFSALGTVGLSLGITAGLSDMSKIVITLTMFAGRVGVYTFFLGILKKTAGSQYYKYPMENVIIT